MLAGYDLLPEELVLLRQFDDVLVECRDGGILSGSDSACLDEAVLADEEDYSAVYTRILLCAASPAVDHRSPYIFRASSDGVPTSPLSWRIFVSRLWATSDPS
jgi:hypothetical protein